jgi:hypothetical protein
MLFFMFLSSFFSHFRLPNRRNAQFRCKVTTKNAHTQENEHFFLKKDRFYLSIEALPMRSLGVYSQESV